MTLAIVALLPAGLPQSTPPAYEVARSTGDHDFMFSFRQNAQAVFQAPQEDMLSAWQPMPFPWKFFGQDVAGYYISDNGYITFDKGAKTSVPANTTLPDPAAPRASIFAFWTDLRLEAGRGPWTNSVYAATFGQAPARQHVIYWLSVLPKGGAFETSAFSFALAISEGGEFEVIFTSGRKGIPVKATVGATSPDGKPAVLAEGPAFDYPNVGFGGADDVNYRFRPVRPRTCATWPWGPAS
jgi:hypothetical protein